MRNITVEFKESPSKWVGVVGDKIELRDVKARIFAGWATQYGNTYVYEIIDKNHNVFIWKTGKLLSSSVVSLKGTIKAHTMYHYTKQTELTRCKEVE